MNPVEEMLALDRILSGLANLIQMTLHIDFDDCELCNANAFAVHAGILSACHAQLLACDGRTNHAKLLNRIEALVSLLPKV